MLSILLLLSLPIPGYSCDNGFIHEPPIEEAVDEGPTGITGLYGLKYIVGTSILYTYRHINGLDFSDNQFTPAYEVQAYPRLYVLSVPGQPDRTWVDRGQGIQGIPQGKCEEITEVK